MKMKYFCMACLVLFFCACDDEKEIDPTVMPPVTSQGAETFGCLIDGWIYASGRFGKPSGLKYSVAEGDSVVIVAPVGNDEKIHLSIINPKEGAAMPYIDAFFGDWNLGGGQVTLTHVGEGFISGTFSGGQMKEGRFDVKLTSPYYWQD